MQALAGAAIALLSGHLQEFLTGLHEEAPTVLFDGKVRGLLALLDVAPTGGTPNVGNINKLFSSIGLPKRMDSLTWRRTGNDPFKKKLREFNELRKRIGHRGGETVSKAQVQN